MSGTDLLFLDTSILIAKTVHSFDTKSRIKQQTKRFDRVVTSAIVRQEYKRRLLLEADYLLRTLDRKGSYAAVRRHIDDVLPPQHNRKRNICAQMLNTVFEQANDQELTERLQRYLRLLLTTGLVRFEQMVTNVIEESRCGLSMVGVREVRPYEKYEVGRRRCSQTPQHCGICDFAVLRQEVAVRLVSHLDSLSSTDANPEVKQWLGALRTCLENPRDCRDLDPCLKLGDLFIAMESASVPYMYTMNGKDSQYFCRALNQTLIVRPRNPDHDDIICRPEDPSWQVSVS